MKNPILPKPVATRDEVTQFVQKYLEESRDNPIWLFDKFIFKWYERWAGKEGVKIKHVSAVRCSGPFNGTWNYGRGLLQINLFTYCDAERAGFNILITNIDDGAWRAYKDFDSLEAANKFFDEFFEFWKAEVDEKFEMILPTEQELNAIISKVGLWGVPE